MGTVGMDRRITNIQGLYVLGSVLQAWLGTLGSPEESSGPTDHCVSQHGINKASCCILRLPVCCFARQIMFYVHCAHLSAQWPGLATTPNSRGYFSQKHDHATVSRARSDMLNRRERSGRREASSRQELPEQPVQPSAAISIV